MDPKKFLELATLLASGTTSPEKLRSATSRAYYAVYNVCAQALSNMGFRVGSGPGGHGDVRNRLGCSKDVDLSLVSSQLGTLHSNRIAADYRLNDPKAENPMNVKAHIQQAKKMIATLENRCSGPTRANIIAAIKEWERLTNSENRPSS